MAPHPRFAVDHMLGKLGSYLRCLGYDASADAERRTHDLIRAANAEGRVFLTRNRRLPHAYPRPQQGLCVISDDPVEQLHEVIGAFGLDAETHLFTRCVRCNLELAAVPPEADLVGRVPAKVLEHYREFTQCPSCGAVFWRGTHVRNTCRKLGLADVSRPRAGLDPW